MSKCKKVGGSRSINTHEGLSAIRKHDHSLELCRCVQCQFIILQCECAVFTESYVHLEWQFSFKVHNRW